MNEKEVILVSKETYDWLVEELNKPPRVIQSLKRLFQSTSVWEKESTENDKQ
jgi:uncharacterized protein (DUF1778 family)